MTTQNTVRNLGAQNLGVIPFDGSRRSSNGLNGDQFAFAEFTVPNPIPADWMGKVSRIAAYAPSDGGLSAFKWMSISKVMGEWGAPIGNKACVQGQSVQLIVSWGQDRPGSTKMVPGDRWYINVQNRLPWMGSGSQDTDPSCGPGYICDFTMDASIPSDVG